MTDPFKDYRDKRDFNQTPEPVGETRASAKKPFFVIQMVRDDTPWVFLYRPTYFWAVSKKLGDWAPTSRGSVNLTS